MTAKKVAIVGFSARLPGGRLDDLWDNLCAGTDLVGEIPDDRWSHDVYAHPSRSQPGTVYTTRAGSIGDIAGFDAEFFGISPREAEQLDPQQRLLLEMSWEAFESAGIRPADVRGSRGGVFIGFSGSDWSYRRADDLASLDATSMTGQTGSVAANRLSYQFDLRGPSVAVDTACSSSLVAFHQACRSIETGESDLALTGGIALHIHPYAFVGFARASMLSPRGVCNVFDADGDGYVRSEGGGIFLLKPLDRARADGDRILAVVAGTGVNCDGRTQGITVPGVETQAALLKEVYERAGVDPDDLDYVEAHGTGTAVGDPIECHSLGVELGRRRDSAGPLLIGSVKSNMGHLETASGVAGLVKSLLCLQHRAVPPTIHVKKLNPHIDFDGWNLRAVTELTPLAGNRTLTIGVNSFGFGGANAHVVLQGPFEDPVGREADAAGQGDRPAAVPLVLSGRGGAAVRAAAAQLATFLRERPYLNHYDVAYSLALHREWHRDRAVVLAADPAAQLAVLEQFAGGETPVGLVAGQALPVASAPAFVYSGNGSQWAGMGATLWGESAVFRGAVEQVDAILSDFGDFSIVDELLSDDAEDRLELTEIAQPTLFAVQVGITEMLRAAGVTPAAVVGHSVGEVAAAWAAGALTLKQAVQVIYERSQHQGTTKGSGAMTAVGIGAEAFDALLRELGMQDRIAVAGVNSPRGVTAAASRDDLAELEDALAEREIFHRRLALDYAFHSPAMDAIRQPLQRDLAGLKPGSSNLPFYSSVTGACHPGNELDAAYWWLNIREPVRFQGAVEQMIADGFNVFVEIGPHAVLRTYINDCLRNRGTEGRVIATLLRGDGSELRVRAAVHQMVADGVPVPLQHWFAAPGRFVDLPTYPWQHKRYWHPVTTDGYGLCSRSKVHPLLGYALHENDTQWENRLDLIQYPGLADHAVGGTAVFPAAGYVEMALAAGFLWHAGELPGGDQADAAMQEIEELEILSPLLLEDAPSKTVRLAIDPTDGRFTIKSRTYLSDDDWQLHAVGRLPGAPSGGQPATDAALPTRACDASGGQHYALTAKVGLDYGPAFRAVTGVWHEQDAVVARLEYPAQTSGDTGYLLDPAVLDGCFQLLVDILADEIGESGGIAFVPVRVGALRLRQAGQAAAFARARLVRRGPRSVVVDYRLFDSDGRVVAEVDGVRFRGVVLKHAVTEKTGYLRFEAVPRPSAAARRSVLPSNGSLPAICAARLHASDRVDGRQQYYAEVEPLLDVLCVAFAEQALRELSDDRRGIDVTRLLAEGVVKTEFAAYLHHLAAMLVEDGMLEPAAVGYTWSSIDELPSAASIWTSLLGDYPDYAAEILMLGRVGQHLGDVLTGRTPVESVLPADPEHPMLAHYLDGSPSLRAGTKALVDMLLAAVQALVPGQRLRILEFTRGHSQLAAQLLPHLDLDRCDYLLASDDGDVLSSLDHLVDLFPQVDRRVLDLGEAATLPQVDVVVLSHELGMLRSPGRVLDYLGGLLLPGGMLVVAEQPAARWLNLVFGLREAWWLGDTEQPLPRLRPPPAWSSLLDHAGLADVVVVHDLPATKDGPYLLLARSSEVRVTEPATVSDGDGCWLIVHDAGGPGAVLAELVAARLRAVGRTPCLAAIGSDFQVEGLAAGGSEEGTGLREMLAATVAKNGAPDGVVLLDGLRFDVVEEGSAAWRCIIAAELARGCAEAGLAPQLLLVTAGATGDLVVPAAPAAPVDDAALWGFGRTLMNEFPEMRIRLIELADPNDPEGAAGEILDEIVAPDAEDEVIYSPAGRFVPRLRALPLAELVGTEAPAAASRQTTRLDFRAPGPLKNLRWRHADLPPLGSDDVEIAVCAAGLNFRDIMYAMGLLSDEAVEAGFAGPTLGMELAGVVTALGAGIRHLEVGDEVIAFAPASFAERVVTTAGAVAKKPAAWSFNAAATVPTTFFTAYYALHHLARLQEGERLLVHGAAGGVGLAAIQLGRAMGAEIFATVGSDAKRDVVQLLGADHVLDSRSLAFADDILAATGGEGIDVVLNSLAGEAINRNLRVLRPFGRFLELGKRDFYENTRIGLRPFRNNISYFGIDADQLMAERPALTRRLFGELMELFADGTLKPLPYRAFPAAQAVEAFRYMQQSRQIGKVVLNFDDGAGAVEPATPRHLALTLPARATYLVTGGMRGFGLETARWLVSRGARYLVLLSRRGAADEEAAPVIEAMQKQGVQVRAVACDVTDRDALSMVFDDIAASMPPLRGIVHAAMVIDDGLVRNLDPERIRRVMAPKVAGAQNLDALSRDLELDFFVLYSSATTMFGNPGQASYVAANRYLEVLAHARRAAGLPALCVSWGAIDDVGYLARNARIKEQLQSRMGAAALDSAEALRALEQLLVRNLSGLGVMELDWSALRRFLPTALAPKFQELAHLADEAGHDADGYEQLQRWLEELDDEQLAAALADVLKREIGEILHVAAEKIDDNRSLYELGMDSLMGMELVSAVENRFGVTVPLMALSEGLTVSRLVQTLIRQLRAPGESDDAGHGTIVAQVAARHEGSADADLVDEVKDAIGSAKGEQRSLLDDK